MSNEMGQNLANEFKSILLKTGIPVQYVGRAKAIINSHNCSLIYSNSSRRYPNGFNEYFYGIVKTKFEEMFYNEYKFLILVSGKNLGKKAVAKITNQKDISSEEIEIISKSRIEHVFIIPFKKLNQLINRITPAQYDQIKINVYINKNFEFLISGEEGSERILGDEVNEKYLNTFEQLGIGSTKSNKLKEYFELMKKDTKRYFLIYNRYRHRLD